MLADGFSLESEWQQVSLGLQDSSQDSGRSQQCCRVDGLYPSANLQVLQAFKNPLVIAHKARITIDIIVTFMFHSFLNSLARSRYLSFFSLSVLSCSPPGEQSRQFWKFSNFFCWLLLALVFWPGLGDLFVY